MAITSQRFVLVAAASILFPFSFSSSCSCISCLLKLFPVFRAASVMTPAPGTVTNNSRTPVEPHKYTLFEESLARGWPSWAFCCVSKVWDINEEQHSETDRREGRQY